MVIWDLFRKKKEKVIERISFDKLDFYIEKELKELGNSFEELKNEINSSLNDFCININEKLPELKNINLDKKREDERLKKIVIENLNLYVSQVENLVKELEKLVITDLRELILKVQSIFSMFIKNSKSSYERATILIGNELGNIKDLISNFVRTFNRRLEINLRLTTRKNLVNSLKDELRKLEDAKKVEKGFNDFAKSKQDNIAKLEEELKTWQDNLKEYKKSKKYADFLNEKEKITQFEKNKNEEAIMLKNKIDFKNLLGIFHGDEKKRELIKKYSDNFVELLKSDDNLKIIEILKQSGQDLENEFRKARRRLLERKEAIKDESLEEIEDKISEIKQEILDETDVIEREQNKKEKFKGKQGEILREIRERTKEIFSDFIVDF